MVIARFQFKPGAADQFCWAASQEIVEMAFEEATEVVELCKELEDAIADCIVLVGNQVLVLSGFTS